MHMTLNGSKALLPLTTLTTDSRKEGGIKMFDTEDEKIIQIMPAPQGGYGKHKDENGFFYVKIVGMALTKGGDVVFLDTDSYGAIDILDDDVEVVFLKEEPKDEYKE